MIRRKKTWVIDKFLGLNEARVFDNSFTGEASRMENFVVAPDFSLKKRDGYSFILSQSGGIKSIWCGKLGEKSLMLFVSGDKLYSYDFTPSPASLLGFVGDSGAAVFSFGDFVYILSGNNYYRYNGSTLSTVDGYIPTIFVNSAPDGEGTKFEDINILTGKVSQLYNGNGSSSVFKLGKKGAFSVDEVKVGGSTALFTYDNVTSSVTLTTPPPSGINNVKITYSFPATGRYMVSTCKGVVLCGGGNDTRLMVWGSGDSPEYCFYSELADGKSNVEYFPENNFIKLSGHKINDIVRHYDRQIIYTDKGAFYSYASSVTDSLGVVRYTFPVFTLSSQKGNLAPDQAVVIDNYPVTVWYDGIYKWVSTNIRDERNAKLISQRVSKTFSEILPNPATARIRMLDFENRGELWVASQGKVLVYNYRLDLWHSFSGLSISCFCAVGDDVYFGTDDGKIGKISAEITTDNGSAIACVWETPAVSFGEVTKMKELRELSVLLGDEADKVDIYWKTDDQIGDTEPFHAGAYSSNQKPKLETVRLGVKRFNTAKLTLISDDLDSAANIISLSVTTKG